MPSIACLLPLPQLPSDTRHPCLALWDPHPWHRLYDVSRVRVGLHVPDPHHDVCRVPVHSLHQHVHGVYPLWHHPHPDPESQDEDDMRRPGQECGGGWTRQCFSGEAVSAVHRVPQADHSVRGGDEHTRVHRVSGGDCALRVAVDGPALHRSHGLEDLASCTRLRVHLHDHLSAVRHVLPVQRTDRAERGHRLCPVRDPLVQIEREEPKDGAVDNRADSAPVGGHDRQRRSHYAANVPVHPQRVLFVFQHPPRGSLGVQIRHSNGGGFRQVWCWLINYII